MIYVIIPVFNRLDFTKSCLASIKKQKNCEKIKIIIVDDGSTDGTFEYLEKEKNLTVLKGTGSLFWGGAVNFGIDEVLKIGKKGDWVFLVNNDVELSNDAIIKLIQVSVSKNRKAIVGALTLDLNDKQTIIKSGTIVENWFFNKTRHIYKRLNINQITNKEPVEVDFLTGRCLLHPIEVFQIAGNYDSKSFPHYGGDDEFSMRVKKYNYLTFVSPKSLVYLNLKKQEDKKKPNLKKFLFVFFNIKSSSNILNKFKLSLKIVPFHAKLTFFFMGLLKSLYIFFNNK